MLQGRIGRRAENWVPHSPSCRPYSRVRAECDMAGQLKTCVKCGEAKPATVEHFYVRGTSSAGKTWFRGSCKPCFISARMEYDRVNELKVGVRRKNYKRVNSERIRARERARYLLKSDEYKKSARVNRLSRLFGLSPEGYSAMLEAQGGICAMPGCGSSEADSRGYRLHVDHCHATGQVRRLLCAPCNKNLGIYEANHERFALYLQQFKSEV